MTLLRGVLAKSILSSIVLVLVATSTVVAAQPKSGSGAAAQVSLKGRAAEAFNVPSDVRLVRTWRDAKHNLTFSRYQQYKQPFDALVDGAQLTVVKRGATTVLVTGAHYSNLAVTNRLSVSGPQAVVRALGGSTLRGNLAAEGGAKASDLNHRTDLRLNPEDGRLYQRVQSGAPGFNVVSLVDAETGDVVAAWDALANVEPGKGTGVKGDRKNLGGPPADPTDLTTYVSGTWRMKSNDAADSRIRVLDANHTQADVGPIMTDQDNDWAGAYQRAAVDAQYYSALTDKWYLDVSNVGGFDLEADCDAETYGYGKIRNLVHFASGYSNAFFDSITGSFYYGDGDGTQYTNFAGGQDVVSHEMTHRVTECRAPLDYIAYSGALNEAISDIMAVAMEWELNEPISSNCRRASGQAGCPDWWVGEDVGISGPFAFRNIADPEVLGDPSHWDNRVCPGLQSWCGDNRGVHSNSLIANHAFYLMANGGRNGRCSGPTDAKADCDVVVPAIPIADATQIFFTAFGMLANPAFSTNQTSLFATQFCSAREETINAAELLFPGSDLHRAAAYLAWAAVGVKVPNGTACDASDTLLVKTSPRSIVLAPGGSGSLDVTVAAATSVSVGGGSPATVAYDEPNTEIDITVPNDMPEGVYPLVVIASGSGTPSSKLAAAVLIVDATDPKVALNGVSLNNTGTVSASGTVPLTVNWSASDATSGLSSSHLQRETAPDTWANISSGTGPSTVITGNNLETFRVIATDGVGNGATSPESGPWSIGRFQETAPIYKGTWTTAAASGSWGGSVRYATASGARARFVFTGNEAIWVSTRASNKGKAKVYLDGVFQRKVNLAAGTYGSRQIVYRATGLSTASHTLRIVVVTSGKRVEIDGFVTLSH